jgi:hypothetical protein
MAERQASRQTPGGNLPNPLRRPALSKGLRKRYADLAKNTF